MKASIFSPGGGGVRSVQDLPSNVRLDETPNNLKSNLEKFITDNQITGYHNYRLSIVWSGY